MIALSLACGPYDRTLPVVDGRVRMQGVDLTAVALPVEEALTRAAVNREFDVAEFSFATYLMTLEKDAPFVAIPVFPSRAFRHSGIFVNADAGITEPEHLAGRMVGVPHYHLTAAVWIRGILSEFHSVPVESVRYRTGRLDGPVRVQQTPKVAPGVEIEAIRPDETLGQLLAEGRIDAIYSPRVPPEFRDGDPRIRRLYANPRAVETEYYRRTRIFPIMHTIVIRREVYERNRWLAISLMKAFTEAKRIATAGLMDTTASSATLPFAYSEVEDAVELMGQDYWPYGMEANRRTLETLVRYEQEQGLITKRFAIEDLFAPETLSSAAL